MDGNLAFCAHTHNQQEEMSLALAWSWRALSRALGGWAVDEGRCSVNLAKRTSSLLSVFKPSVWLSHPLLALLGQFTRTSMHPSRLRLP